MLLTYILECLTLGVPACLNSMRPERPSKASEKHDECSRSVLELSPFVSAEESTSVSRNTKARPDRVDTGRSVQGLSSSTSGTSDDLQGLLLPGRTVILRFESMSASELKASTTKDF